MSNIRLGFVSPQHYYTRAFLWVFLIFQIHWNYWASFIWSGLTDFSFYSRYFIEDLLFDCIHSSKLSFIFIVWETHPDIPPQEYSWWEHSKHRAESYSQHCLWLRHVRVYCQPSRMTFAHFLFCIAKVLFLPFCCIGARTLRPLSWAPMASPTGFLSSFWRKGCLMMRRLLCCWTELQRVKNNARYSYIRDKAPAVTVSLAML